MGTIAEFRKMLEDTAPMFFIVGEQLPLDPWRFKTLRCFVCCKVYSDMQKVGRLGTICPHCGDNDKEFKWGGSK